MKYARASSDASLYAWSWTFWPGRRSIVKTFIICIIREAQELRCDPAAIRVHRGAIQGWLQTRLARHPRERRALQEAQDER